MPKAGNITRKLYRAAIKMDTCSDYAKVCYYAEKMHRLKQRGLTTLHAEFQSPPTVHWMCLFSALNLYGVPVAEVDFSRPQQVELRAPASDKPIDVDDDFALDENTGDSVFQPVAIVPNPQVLDFFVPQQLDFVGDAAPSLPRSYYKDHSKKRRAPRLTARQMAIAQADANIQVMLMQCDPLYTNSDEGSTESEASF